MSESHAGEEGRQLAAGWMGSSPSEAVPVNMGTFWGWLGDRRLSLWQGNHVTVNQTSGSFCPRPLSAGWAL